MAFLFQLDSGVSSVSVYSSSLEGLVMAKMLWISLVLGALFNVSANAQGSPEAPFPNDGIWVWKGASIDCGRKPEDTFFEVKGKEFRFVTPNGSDAKCSMYKGREHQFTDVLAMEISFFCRYQGDKKQHNDSNTVLFHTNGSIFYRAVEHVKWCPSGSQSASASNLDAIVLGKIATMSSRFDYEGRVIAAKGVDTDFAQLSVQSTKNAGEAYCEGEARLRVGTARFRQCVAEQTTTVKSMANCKTGEITLGFQESRPSAWQLTDAAKSGRAKDSLEKFSRTFWKKVGRDDPNEIIPVYPLNSYFNHMCPTSSKQWKISQPN